jgi:hypothetical protein
VAPLAPGCDATARARELAVMQVLVLGVLVLYQAPARASPAYVPLLARVLLMLYRGLARSRRAHTPRFHSSLCLPSPPRSLPPSEPCSPCRSPPLLTGAPPRALLCAPHSPCARSAARRCAALRGAAAALSGAGHQ